MNEYNIQYVQQCSLASLTTFKTGGICSYFFLAKNYTEIKIILQKIFSLKLPIFLFGKGSNIILSDSFLSGCIFTLAGSFKNVQISFNCNMASAGSACLFSHFAKKCIEIGWMPALGWCGIPGTIGGAIRMNSGTHLGNISQKIYRIEIFMYNTRFSLSCNQLLFLYRYSNISVNCIVSGAIFKFNRLDKCNENLLLVTTLNMARIRKQFQPKQRSAGSVFRNFENIFVATCIQIVRLRGYQYGKSKISNIHSNFIVNDSKSTSKHVVKLARLIQIRIYNNFNIKPTYEIKHFGFSESI